MSDLPEAEPLAFDDANGTSAQRVENGRVMLTPVGRFVWRVAFFDGDAHRTQLALDRRGYLGACDCRGFEHHDGACAHLWAVKRAAEAGHADIESVVSALEAPPTCPNCGQYPEQGAI